MCACGDAWMRVLPVVGIIHFDAVWPCFSVGRLYAGANFMVRSSACVMPGHQSVIALGISEISALGLGTSSLRIVKCPFPEHHVHLYISPLAASFLHLPPPFVAHFVEGTAPNEGGTLRCLW